VLLLRAADFATQQGEQLFKSHGLTGTQYNVLRILRGAGPQGLPCRIVGDRMISHDPDMTRLLDRMEKRGMILRERQKDDRRVVKARITASGVSLRSRTARAMSTARIPVRPPGLVKSSFSVIVACVIAGSLSSRAFHLR